MSLSLDVRAIDKGDEAKKGSPPKVKQEFRVYIGEEAFDHAVERGGADTTREVGGILVGEVLRDDSGPFIRVDVALDALHAEEKGAELTFTHATWEHLNKEMDTKYSGKKVVGWWHTHPGFGVFLSDRDQFIHRSFFNLPFQIALVYDPKAREHGIFTWRDNEPWRARRYFIGEREQTWDAARVLPEKDKKENSKGKDKDQKARESDDKDKDDRRASTEEHDKPMDWGTVGMAAVFALLLGGLIGFWMGGSGRRDGGAKQTGAPGQTELLMAYDQGQKDLAGQVNGALVNVLRESLNDEASRRMLEDAIAAVSEAEKALAAPGAAPAEAQAKQAKLKAAREKLEKTFEQRGAAVEWLSKLEQEGTKGGRQTNLTGVARELMTQRHFLGLAYAELAMEVSRTDPKRAKRLLETAAKIDEPGFEGYQARLNEFDKEGKLTRPQGAPPAPGPAPAPAPGPAPAPAPQTAPGKPVSPGTPGSTP